MKMLTALFMLMFAIGSFASSTDSRTFSYDGSQDSIRFDLRTEKTHTEYRYEQRHTICYRQEVVYRTVCSQTPEGRVCRTVPHYRTISYPCIQTIRIPYEVKDYDVEARVNISVEKMPVQLSRSEKLVAKLRGDSLTLSAAGTKKFFIILKHQKVTSRMTGSVKLIDADYHIELVEAAPVMMALNLTDISLQESKLNFKMGPVAVRDLIGFSLLVKKSPLLGSDTVLFDRELAVDEILLNAQENASVAQVDIEKLGIELAGGRHKITAKAFFKYSGSVMNSSDFEHLEHSRTLIYKN